MNARRVTGAIVLTGLLLASCGSSSKSSGSSPTTTATSALPNITVTASEYQFTAPATVPSGWVDVTLVNHGTALEGHQVNIVKLGSLTAAQAKAAAIKQDINVINKSGAVFVGGPNTVDPGKSGTVAVHLEDGSTYALFCLIPAPNGKSHVALGMFTTFKAAKSAQSVETPPVAANKVVLGDFVFQPPKPFNGKAPIEVTNEGVQVHEMVLARLNPGKTLDEAKAFFLSQTTPTGPPPFTSVTSMTGLSPKQTGYLTESLAPGKYIAICFFPDPTKGGLPHAIVDKMVSEIDVG